MDYTAWKKQICNRVGKTVKSRSCSKPRQHKHRKARGRVRQGVRRIVRCKVTQEYIGNKALSGKRVKKRFLVTGALSAIFCCC